MSVYNGERYLASAIDSILGQTFRDFEFLIVDDGSKDGTADLLAKYAREDPRVHVVTHGKNKGLTASLNELVQLVKGEYLARMDADDVSRPERFARQVEWLDNHAACGLVGSAYTFIDLEGRAGMTFRFENDHHYLQWYLCYQNPLAHPAVMGRTALFRAVGGYREEFRYGQDFDLWWRLSFTTQLACLPEPLTFVRRNPTGLSGVHQPEQLVAKRRILTEMLPRLGMKDVEEVLLRGAPGESIRRIYACFSGREGVSERIKELIRRDSAARLGLIWLRHPFKRGSAEVLRDSLAYCPAVLLRGVFQMASRWCVSKVDNPIIR
ncbi:MAG TPA: glycosyltransferase [Verrucomicrobiae bacterium]